MLNYFSFLSIRDKVTERLADELKIPYISTVDTAFLDSPEVKIPYELQLTLNNKQYMVFVHNKISGIKDFIKEKNNVKVYVDVDELSIFDSYFRHLYRIFKYIDESTLIENVKGITILV